MSTNAPDSVQETEEQGPPVGEPPALVRRDDELSGEHHVYEPHRVGLPPIGTYLKRLWERREFAFELSRTKMRAQHFNTVFGQLWLVLNPLLLALVYFVLVDILRDGSRGPQFLAHLTAGLFAYYFVSDSVRQASRSVVSAGRLILNTPFPRVLLPLSAVVTGFKRFLPTLAVYVPIHVLSGLPIGWHLLWALPLVGLLALIAAGVSMLAAAAQVYFRDLASFLPYVMRIWLYASPVLYFAAEVPERYRVILVLNPLGAPLTAWSEVLNGGSAPSPDVLGLSLAWGLVLLAAGALFFVSREREFAVRL